MANRTTTTEYSKMYVLIKDWVDTGHAVNTACHAGAMIRSRGWPDDDPVMADWYKTSFRKATCAVTEEQFEKAKTYGLDYFSVQEMAFDSQDIALVFKPRKEWPKFFSFLNLWK